MRRGITLAQAVKLLDNPQFRKEAKAISDAAVALAQPGTLRIDHDARWEALITERVRPFYLKWGVLPPHADELIDPNPRRPFAFAIGSGRWGIIPVYPWTTEAEVQVTRRRIQRKTGKVHRDAFEAERKAQIAEWLRLHRDARGRNISRAEIARVVWERKTDLRRPTKAQVIDRVPAEKEREFLHQYMNQGLTRGQAGRRVYRRLRGPESKAGGQVRQAEARYERKTRKLIAELEQPRKCEPIAFALTNALRAIHSHFNDSAQALRYLRSLWELLLATR